MKALVAHAVILLAFPLVQFIMRGSIHLGHFSMFAVGAMISAVVFGVLREQLTYFNKTWTAAFLTSTLSISAMSLIVALSVLAVIKASS